MGRYDFEMEVDRRGFLRRVAAGGGAVIAFGAMPSALRRQMGATKSSTSSPAESALALDSYEFDGFVRDFALGDGIGMAVGERGVDAGIWRTFDGS